MFTYTLKAKNWNEQLGGYEMELIAEDLTKEECIEKASEEKLTNYGKPRLFLDEHYTMNGKTEINRKNQYYESWAETRKWF